MEGDLRAATARIAQLQAAATEAARTHHDQLQRVEENHEAAISDLDIRISTLGREVNNMETRFRCGVCYDTFGDDLVFPTSVATFSAAFARTGNPRQTAEVTGSAAVSIVGERRVNIPKYSYKTSLLFLS